MYRSASRSASWVSAQVSQRPSTRRCFWAALRPLHGAGSSAQRCASHLVRIAPALMRIFQPPGCSTPVQMTHGCPLFFGMRSQQSRGVPNSCAQFRRRDAKPERSARMFRTSEYGIGCNVHRSDILFTENEHDGDREAVDDGAQFGDLGCVQNRCSDSTLTPLTGASIAEIVSAFPTCGGL